MKLIKHVVLDALQRINVNAGTNIMVDHTTTNLPVGSVNLRISWPNGEREATTLDLTLRMYPADGSGWIVRIPEDEEVVLHRAVFSAVRSQRAAKAVIFLGIRDKSGWLEHGLNVGGMFIGVLQRSVGAEVESHS